MEGRACRSALRTDSARRSSAPHSFTRCALLQAILDTP